MALNKDFHSDLFPLIWNRLYFDYLTTHDDPTGMWSVEIKKGA